MSFKLDVDPPTHGWFTSGDKVTGRVTLKLHKSSQLSSITVNLAGVCSTQLSKVVDKGQKYTETQAETLYVLDEQLRVFPPPEVSALDILYTLGPGIHTFEFEFVLSMYALPQGSEGALARRLIVLPPSLSDLADDVLVQYFVKAKASRGASGSIFSGGSQVVYHYFVFLPGDVPSDNDGLSLESSAGGSLISILDPLGVWSKLRRRALETPSRSTVEKPRLCSSAIFRISVRSDVIPGSPFSPELYAELKTATSLVVLSIDLELRVVTHAQAKMLKREFEQRVQLLRRSKLNTVIEKHMQSEKRGTELVSPQSLQISIPDVFSPSFKVSLIERRYELVAKIKYTHTPGSKNVHRSVLSVPIRVKSGVSIPDWQTGQVERSTRNYNQQSQYYHKRPAWATYGG